MTTSNESSEKNYRKLEIATVYCIVANTTRWNGKAECRNENKNDTHWTTKNQRTSKFPSVILVLLLLCSLFWIFPYCRTDVSNMYNRETYTLQYEWFGTVPHTMPCWIVNIHSDVNKVSLLIFLKARRKKSTQTSFLFVCAFGSQSLEEEKATTVHTRNHSLYWYSTYVSIIPRYLGQLRSRICTITNNYRLISPKNNYPIQFSRGGNERAISVEKGH